MNRKKLALVLVLPLIPLLSLYDASRAFLNNYVRQLNEDWQAWKESWDGHSCVCKDSEGKLFNRRMTND